MKTMENHTAPVSALLHKITVHTSRIIGEGRTGPLTEAKTVIKIRLDDQCGNGHEDFSLTAVIYEGGRDVGGGCCHEHILTLRPDLKPFADLHLSDAEGAPIHAAANAFYWYAGTRADGVGEKYHGGSGRDGETPEACRAIFLDHIRGTDADFAAIDAFGPRSSSEMSYILESLGFRARWKAEAVAAIKTLEDLTGQKFATVATRRQWEPLTPEAVELIEKRRAEGYYTPEATAARDAEAARIAEEKKVASIHAEYAATVDKAGKKRDIALLFISLGISDRNTIFYDHTGEIAFNWSSCEKLWTREEFDAFAASLKPGDLPEGVTLRFQDKPRF